MDRMRVCSARRCNLPSCSQHRHKAIDSIRRNGVYWPCSVRSRQAGANTTMKRMNFDKSCRWLAGFLLVAGTLAAQQERQRSVAPEQDLMDGGKSIMKYVIEVPAGIAPAGTTDPAKQVGLVICSQEHDNPTGNDIFPVRQTFIR